MNKQDNPMAAITTTLVMKDLVCNDLHWQDNFFTRFTVE